MCLPASSQVFWKRASRRETNVRNASVEQLVAVRSSIETTRTLNVCNPLGWQSPQKHGFVTISPRLHSISKPPPPDTRTREMRNSLLSAERSRHGSCNVTGANLVFAVNPCVRLLPMLVQLAAFLRATCIAYPRDM